MVSTTSPTNDIAAWLGSAERRLARPQGGWSATIRRRLEFPVARVWSVFTEPEKIARWVGPVTGDAKLGGTVQIEIGGPHRVQSKILRCDREKLLSVTWWYLGVTEDKADAVELRLHADGHATVVEIEHRSPDTADGWQAGTGWEYTLLRVSVLLDGGNPDAVVFDELDPKIRALWAPAREAALKGAA